MFFVAVFSAAESGGVGTAEPQMLAQALFLAGLYVYMRGQRKGPALEASALLFVVAGNIKHSPIEFPLAVLLDLLLTAPWRALRFAAVCAALAAVSFAITAHVDGAAYVACLLAPRSYFFILSVWKTLWTLAPMLLPVLAALWMSRRALGNPACRVLALLLYCALALNAFFIGGSGVGENALFGTLTAVVVLCAVLGGGRAPAAAVVTQEQSATGAGGFLLLAGDSPCSVWELVRVEGAGPRPGRRAALRHGGRLYWSATRRGYLREPVALL
jgi:hypothetical protein